MKKISQKVGKIASKENKEKAKKAVKEAGGFIAKNKKEVAYFAVGLVGFYVVYKLYKGINKASDAVGDILESPEVDTIKTDLQINPKNLTVSAAHAELLAKSLLDAFNKTILFGQPSSDTEKISQVFDEIKTGDDLRLVHKKFGLRKRAMGGTPTTYMAKKLADSYDLTYWLKEEVSSFFDPTLYKKIESRFKMAQIPF
ncbi:hypothetical protein ACQY1Q_06070 [Tenacibaculum sp. TC6]|uniref:hypothetical protein n=1 Tax=Tenacibaculum sp. TC6 TaxID=3423223 RepID=UPI003D36BF0A